MEAAPFWAEMAELKTSQLDSLENLLASTKPWQGTCCLCMCVCARARTYKCVREYRKLAGTRQMYPIVSKYISEMLNLLRTACNDQFCFVYYRAEHPFPADIFGRLHSPPR